MTTGPQVSQRMLDCDMIAVSGSYDDIDANKKDKQLSSNTGAAIGAGLAAVSPSIPE